MSEAERFEFSIEGMDCPSCALDIEKVLLKLRGVSKAQVRYIGKKAVVEYNSDKIDEARILAAVGKLGYEAKPLKEEAFEEEEEEKERSRLYAVAIGAPLLIAGLILSWLGIWKGREEILYGLALAVAVAPVLRNAVKRFKANPFNTDVLMGTAGVGAFLIGHFEDGAAVILLYNLAEIIEDYTVDRVRKTARKLAALLPKRALVKKNGSLVEVPVEELKVGDIVVIKPGWRIPIDGIVVSGRSSVDQASITGESMPVEKFAGEEVLSGTLNLEGSLEVSVQKLFYDSTTSRIIKLVMEAQERKANIEKFVDKFSRYYTPAMLGLAVLVALVPPLVFGEAFSTWIYRALIVLIIACPSAFLISTPVTVLIGLTRAMRSGVLVKGGMYLEEISRVKAVAFDKTGTFTMGRPEVVEVIPAKDYEKEEVLRLAATAEAKSAHPIAQAILKEAEAKGIEIGDAEIRDIAGKGVVARFEGGEIIAGKLSFLSERRVAVEVEARENQIHTQVGIAVDGQLAGVICVADRKRPEARETVKMLRKLGVEKVVMLTGDNEEVAKSIAKEIGVAEYYAGLLPEDKVRIAKELRDKYGSVAMVGDGVNDAPVLAASNVGIAIGSAGNDIAIEAADVALMGSDLRSVPYLIQLGRKTTSKLRINLGIVLALKFAMIALGLLGLIPLWIAVLGDDGVTLLVIANALPLLRVKSH